MNQTLLATLIVLAAAAWLLRRVYLTVRAAVSGQGDCLSRCGGCSRNPANDQTPVVTLGDTRSTSAIRTNTR